MGLSFFSLQYGNYRDLTRCAHANAMLLFPCKIQIGEKNQAPSNEKFPCLVLDGYTIMSQLNTLLSIFRSIICRLVNGRLNTNENFKLLALLSSRRKVSFETSSLARDLKNSDLAWRLLVFWKTGL